MGKLKFEAKRLKYFIWFFTIVFALNLICPEGMARYICSVYGESVEKQANFLNISKHLSAIVLVMNLTYLSLIKHMEKTIVKLSKPAE